MLGRYSKKSKSRDEAEKPFWISYADLMSALMVLFLVVMTVSMLAITKKVSSADELEKERQDAIAQILKNIGEISPDVIIDKSDFRIKFINEHSGFAKGDWQLTDSDTSFLRSYVSKLLVKTSDPLSKRWIKRYVVEGYTDKTGTYLFNLDLSLKRSESLICVLLAKDQNSDFILKEDELSQIRDMFMIGGFAFNNPKDTEKESRRIEIRMEFWEVNEKKDPPKDYNPPFGECSLKK